MQGEAEESPQQPNPFEVAAHSRSSPEEDAALLDRAIEDKKAMIDNLKQQLSVDMW